MKNASMSFYLLNYMMSEHNLYWLQKTNHDRAGYHEAKGYSSRKRFKRNQRKGL